MKQPFSTTPTKPQPAKNNTLLYLLLGIFGFVFIGLFVFIFMIHSLVARATGTNLLSNSGEITLIEIQGPIYESDDIVRRIRKFERSSKSALLIRLNSPGGAVAPSQEIFSEILNARKAKKIVVASMSSLAASGAYYIASACNKIMADPGTLTGSIGVIAEFPDASGLLKKFGLNFQTIKSGKFKDTGSFSRPMTAPEREYLQGTINDVFQQFVDSVIQGRREVLKEKVAAQLRIKASQVTDQQIRAYILPYADGRVLTGQKAQGLGFVDELGNYEDAVQLTAQLAGIQGEPTVHLDQPIKWDDILDGILPFSIGEKAKSGFQLEYRAF